ENYVDSMITSDKRRKRVEEWLAVYERVDSPWEELEVGRRLMAEVNCYQREVGAGRVRSPRHAARVARRLLARADAMNFANFGNYQDPWRPGEEAPQFNRLSEILAANSEQPDTVAPWGFVRGGVQ